MAFCAQCGSETQGEFCPSCGARADAAPPPATSPSGAALEDHIVHALCYLLMPLTGVLFLVLEPYKKNRGTRFHAFQSILVFAALFLGAQALAILAFTPGLRLIMLVVTLAYPFFACGVWLYLLLAAFRKERVVVPVLGAIAETQA